MPAFVKIESLGPSFNTLAADDKYSRRNMQNFQQQLQTALSQKQEIFSRIFIAFIKPTLNLEHLIKKCESHSFSISQSIDSERGGYLNVQSALLQKTFRQSTCSGVPNTVKISTTSLLSYCSMNMRKIKLKNVSLSEIWNFRTVC